MNKHIVWITELYAPRYYPAHLISGECFWFYEEGKRQGLGFWGRPSGGWREAGVVTSGGSPDYPVALPLGAQLTWLSKTERKYYQAIIKLPQAQILEEFAKNFDFEWDKKRNQARHIMLQFAFAPNGFISLRVGGTKTIEMANYHAQQIEMSWEFFARTHHFSPEILSEQEYFDDYYHALPEYIQKQVDNDNLPLKRWQDYSTKFHWQLGVDFEIFGCRICCVNGTNEFFDKKSIDALKVIPQQYAPAWIKIYHKESGKRLQTFIRFTKQKQGMAENPTDDVDIFEFFKTYLNDQKKYTIILKKIQNNYQAVLMNGINVIEIPIYEVVTSYIADGDLLWF